ncbi:MAG TPA: hypothetical protein VD813_01920, partial [Pseudonocardia sp.]|nr:hypothetical protein [Pseudonocardia sp.]
MKRSAPLLTLLAVAVLGGVLFGVNAINDPANTDAPAPAATSAPGQEAAPADEAAPDEAAAPEAAAPTVAEAAYAGRSSGDEVTVAIAVKDGRAVAYVCDGKRIEAWLEGEVTGGEVTLSSADGTTTITGTLDEARSLGTVAVDGAQWPFAAQAVDAPAGLYEGRADVAGVANRIGWIVLDDGTQVGLNDAGDRVQPAPRLDPSDLDGVTIDGEPVEVTAVDGDDRVI